MIIAIKNRIHGIVQWICVKMFCIRTGLVSHSSHISLEAAYGRDVRIGENVIITSNVEIGDGTYINRNSSVENCVIGKYCSISEGVKINPVEHNLKLVTTHPIAGESGHYGICNQKVDIGNDVLISLNTIILSGVHIGDGAVIGAGAVVTKDIPPYAVAVGVPAKVIRYRLESSEIEKLESIRWWDWPRSKIERNIRFLRRETTQIVD